MEREDQSAAVVDAARIVTCVNFCHGLTSAELVAFGSAQHGYAKFMTMRAQRDELIAALRRLIESEPGYGAERCLAIAYAEHTLRQVQL